MPICVHLRFYEATQDTTGNHMTDDRITTLEAKFAFQEHTLSELNDALCSQQLQIEKLERTCKQLSERIQQLSTVDAGSGQENEKPPHY